MIVRLSKPLEQMDVSNEIFIAKQFTTIDENNENEKWLLKLRQDQPVTFKWHSRGVEEIKKGTAHYIGGHKRTGRYLVVLSEGTKYATFKNDIIL